MVSAKNAWLLIAVLVIVPATAIYLSNVYSFREKLKSQFFYDPTDSEFNDNYERVYREPSRLIKTALRPSPMVAQLPSVYMRRIDHRWEAIVAEIWDYATFGFYLDTLAPVPVDHFYGDGINKGMIVIVYLGGGSQTFRWLTKSRKAAGIDILSNSTAELVPYTHGRTDHTLYSADVAELDGSPTIISCYSTCEARLTITQDTAGFALKDNSDPGYGPSGIALKISFDATLLSRWPEIRAKAVCFAAASIVGFNEEKAFPGHRPTCEAVNAAISSPLSHRAATQ